VILVKVGLREEEKEEPHTFSDCNQQSKHDDQTPRSIVHADF